MPSSAVHALILQARPPLMVRPMSCLVDTEGHTPTLPKNAAFISGMRSSIIELVELLILQLIRGQHNMIIGQLDLSLLKQEIEELV